MTHPNPPTLRPGDNRFVRDVVKRLDRRRMLRKLAAWTALLVLIAAAVMYLTRGRGFGLGGPGKGSGEPVESGGPGSVRAVAAPARCAIRVTKTGITVDGKPMSRDEAVAACRKTTGADVVITGDAREGDWKDLHSALQAVDLKDIAVHESPLAGSASQ
jgi:hypothetical protein